MVPKFRFYIVATGNSEVFGTNNEQVANEMSYSDEHCIIDTENNDLICCEKSEQIKDFENKDE